MKTRYLLSASLAVGSLLVSCSEKKSYVNEVSMKSPDGKLECRFSIVDQKLVYSLKKGDKVVVEPSELGMVINGKDVYEGITLLSTPEKVKGEAVFTTKGNHKEGKTQYLEYQLGGKDSDAGFIVRMYNEGAAFKYDWKPDAASTGAVEITDELTSFRFPKGTVLWTQDANSALGPCEGVWSSSMIEDFKTDDSKPRTYVRTMPITAEVPGGMYAFIQEAGNYGLNWAGIKFDLRNQKIKTHYFQDPKGFKQESYGGEQPWRVILVTDDLNSLVNSDIIESLAPAPDKAIFPQGGSEDWIKPGRSSWTWWNSMSAKNDDQYKFVDMASEFGFEYHLVDEGWKKWDADYNKCVQMLKELCDYSAEKKVGIWAWIRWSDINNPKDDWAQMRQFIKEMKGAGVKGLKVDFMDSASQERLHFYDAILSNTAKQQMMLNLHGSNTPTGEPITWPHELSREGIYGGEQNLWGTLEGEHLTALPFTRLVSGHADFTGGYFGHGPKLRGSSWALQMATNIIYTSPILHWVGNPDDMAKSFPEGSPERELIKSIPSLWDETIVLPNAKIGEFAPFARRKGQEWYIGMINGEKGARNEKVDLSFLPAGKYEVIQLSDLQEKNDGWKVEKKTLSSGDSLSFEMRPRGGGVAWIKAIKE